jgi:hypothetical protein
MVIVYFNLPDLSRSFPDFSAVLNKFMESNKLAEPFFSVLTNRKVIKFNLIIRAKQIVNSQTISEKIDKNRQL